MSGMPSNNPVPGIFNKSLSNDTAKAQAAKPILPDLARSG